ncbi:MAG: FtsW/RodA/SpoVE family cell cycle protein [Clostridia bacterium]|nr:FtsW/RodA/SpoVE family cell cycle protein [Clostridia bacterium]
MYDFLILISRYFFVAYIAIFIFAGLIYVVDERKNRRDRLVYVISLQKTMLILMHITAYAILAWKRDGGGIDVTVLIYGAAALAYIFISSFLLRSVYKHGCPLIWNCMYFLMDAGLIMLQRLNPTLAGKQLVWMTVSAAVIMTLPLILKILPKLEKFEIVYFIASVVLILLPFVFGNEEYGSLNWISIKGIGFQPSEIVKFSFLLYVACVFRKPLDMKKLCIVTGFAVFIVLCLVLQKDLGGALIFSVTYILLLYITTSNALLLLAGFGGMALASLLAYKLFGHVRVRVATWLDPWRDAGDTGYQITQSLFAITTWGFLGSGLTRGMPGKIPVVERDFIFSAICEEMGTLFAMGIVCIYILLFLRGMIIAVRAKKRFYSILSAGIVIMFSFQTFLIIGGVIKLIPLTGVTLPFVSYGGSSILVSVALMGLLQWANGTPAEKRGGDNDSEAEKNTNNIKDNKHTKEKKPASAGHIKRKAKQLIG